MTALSDRRPANRHADYRHPASRLNTCDYVWQFSPMLVDLHGRRRGARSQRTIIDLRRLLLPATQQVSDRLADRLSRHAFEKDETWRGIDLKAVVFVIGGGCTTRGEAGAVGVRNVRLTRRILTVSATCGISETKIVCQQIRYSMRSPKRRSLILDTNRDLPGISSPPNYYTGCGVKKWKIKDRNALKLMQS